jgi:ABC-type iron transport system FetAB permease component
MDPSPGGNKQLAVTWLNVAYAGGVLLLDVAVCIYFKLGVAQDLLVAAARCVIQLSLLGLVLDSVFSSQSPAAVIAVTLALILLGANEVSVVRASRHPEGLVGRGIRPQLPSSFISV